MAKPYGIFRATCGHSGCGEFARYEADNRKHYIELSTRYGNGRWLCTRHSKPNEVLSPENPKTVEELRVIDSNGSLYWGKDKAGSGFSNGPGFKAFAKDFPPGTVLRVTAEVISPDAALAEVGGEPVEWQRFVDGFGWQRVNDEDVQHYRDKGVRLRPLYAALGEPEPIGYCSEYGLNKLASQAHHYCLSVSKAQENEFQFPIYAAPSAPDGWQPIDSAPHGVPVLLATPPFKSMGEQAAWELRVGAASWGERIGGISNISRDAWATHWKPLPSPPTGGDSHE